MAVELVTFGCRLNLVESETIERLARAAGLAGIVVRAGSAIVAEPEAVAAAADRAGLFVMGIAAAGAEP